MCKFKNNAALGVFRSLEEPSKWLGRDISAWSLAVTRAPEFGPKLGRIDRQELFKNLQTLSCEQSFIAISAWGSMRVSNGRYAWEARKDWAPVLKSLEDCKSRAEAYTKMKCLRAQGSLRGVGPAYFTKLIFFLRPDLNAYIMDQWTAKSINLLTNSHLVRLLGSQVSDANSEDDYELFCNCIECLAEMIGRKPDCTEERLFGYKSIWREYVKAKYH